MDATTSSGNSQVLIPVFSGSIRSETTQLCDARALHQFLQVGRRFATWITARIREYGFVENLDFVSIARSREELASDAGGLISQNGAIKSRGGDRKSKNYHLTLDMAKELAMVERNEQGRTIRRYFIECERRLFAAMKPVRVLGPRQLEAIKSTLGHRVMEAVNAGIPDPMSRGPAIAVAYRRLGAALLARFGVDDVQKIPAHEFAAARTFLDAERVTWEVVDDTPPAPAPRPAYHYPLASAEPHDRDRVVGNCSMTARVLLDPENGAPELQLIDQLAKDGHDVEGARIRILSMREALEKAERARSRLEVWNRRLIEMAKEVCAYAREEGKNVIFARPPAGSCELEQHVFRDQVRSDLTPP